MAQLIDYFPDWIGNGIFQNLGNWVPWDGDADVSPAALDIEYFGLRSGYRYPSPLLQKMAPVYPTQLDSTQISRLVDVIRSKFSYDWAKLWTATRTSYSPLENYDMQEYGDTGLQRDATLSRETDMTNTGTDSIAAFGSGTYTGIAQSVGNTVGSTLKNVDTTDYDEIGAHTLNRHGNIGVTTSQQMLESEYELRKRHFFDTVFNDVDSILTLPYWE